LIAFLGQEQEAFEVAAAVVFTDGGAPTASWSKAAGGAPTYLLDSAGKPVWLNRGNTWYEIAPTDAAVSY